MAAEKYLALAISLFCLATLCSAESLQDDEKLETFTVDEPFQGRTFITVNGSNIITTPNFVVGITLIGISLALLAGSAASAASMAAASSLAGGAFGPAKYKRSLPDEGFNPSGLWSALEAMEKQFKNFDVTDVECRKRIICEIHQESGEDKNKRLGSLTNVILDTFNNISPEIDSEKYPFFKQYLEAANHGKTKRECSQVYNTCDYSVKNVLRNLSF